MKELFDFIPEDGDRLPDFTPENFNEILAKMTEESVDLSSIVIAPSGGFSYANLPFAQRELKTSVRVSSFCFLSICHFRFCRLLQGQIILLQLNDPGIFHSLMKVK